MIDLTRSCARYRSALIDFVDRGEVRADTRAALAHLERCRRCTEVVESTMLTITALRRMGYAAAGAEPAADAWPRLRVRIEGLRRRPRVMSPLTGIAMSFAIVAVLVLPVRLGATLIGPVATPILDPGSEVSVVDRQIEHAYLAHSRVVPTSSGGGTTSSVPQHYPQEILQVRKEVLSAKPSGRPPQPI